MKIYSAGVLEALGEALRCVYWHKSDLRSFLTRAGVSHSIVSHLNWSQNKRTIVRALLDSLIRHADRGSAVCSKLIDAVVEQDDFPHLRRLDDGDLKVREAAAAVSRLKDLIGRESTVERAERVRQQNRTEAERQRTELRSRQQDLEGTLAEFCKLQQMSDERARGLAFEPFLRRLFALYDLDPRGGFSIPGEQTDGSIRLDTQLFLVEAKWIAEQVQPGVIRSFRGKIDEKLDNTLGLFVAVNGFTDEAVKRGVALILITRPRPPGRPFAVAAA